MAKTIILIAAIISIIGGYLFITDLYYDKGYRDGVQDTEIKYAKTEIKKPEFISFIESSSKNESGLFVTEYIVKNDGNSSATYIQLWIVSDAIIEKVEPLLKRIDIIGIYSSHFEEDRKVFYLQFERLLPSQELPIIFYTNEKPYLKIRNWLCNETATKEAVEKLYKK